MRDRTILVTGGGAGIGRATALLAAEQGARVAILDVDLESANATAEEAARLGAGAALPVRCDVSVESAVEAAVTACVNELGTPYGVFANAGVDRGGMVHELPVEHWTGLIAINLTGVFLTCKHALKAMLAAGTGGSIVCTSSPASLVAFAAGGAAAFQSLQPGPELDRVLGIAAQASFSRVAILPAILLIVFGAIWLYDRSKGGYQRRSIR